MRRVRRGVPVTVLALGALLGLAACGGERAATPRATSPKSLGPAPSAVTADPGSQPPRPRDDGRLPATATPLRYALSLAIDPTQPRFSGTETILVDVPQPTAFVVLHARDIDVRDVHATQGAKKLAATATHRASVGSPHEDELVLTFAEPLAKGQATIAIAYDAPFASDLAGVYRVKVDDRWYAFTQFEATDARRGFPCFDEPGWKTPYDVSITAPKGMIAVGNAPEKTHDDAGTMTTFGFATTRPLPSYLVAFAVGDFDVKPYAGPSSVPIRLVATKGKAKLGDAALEAAAALVKRLGEYFDIQYPYEKLDLVAVPDFTAGAMENAGLITFLENILLVDPKTAGVDDKRTLALVVAHELAHQWFGNLVTLQWWDDLWLNEGFADWMEAKVVDEYKPELRARVAAVRGAQGVMDTDGLRSAHPIRGPVRSSADVEERFDDITYAKAGALLRMLEQWVGEATFQKGVRDYVRAYAWKNAKAEDLLRALDLASNKDVSKVASSFLDRAGVPSLHVSLSCAGDGARAEVKQSPWRPLGEPRPEAGRDAAWSVPVCMRAAGHAGTKDSKDPSDSVCLLASGAPAAAVLKSCPPWIYPNAHQAGYFRFALDPAAMSGLAKNARALEPAERVGLVLDAWAEVESGDLSPGVVLDMVPALDGETDPYVIGAVTSTLRSMRDALVSDASRDAFRAYVAARMKPRARALGWERRKGERDDDALAREHLLGALGDLAGDEATLHEADAIAQRWLKDPSSVSPDVAPFAVVLGSRRGGADRFEALRAAAKSAKSPDVRRIAIDALGGFSDPELARRALDLTLTDELRVFEIGAVLGVAASSPATRPIVWAWTKAHWDALRAKLPAPLTPVLLEGADATCTEAGLDDVKAFVTDKRARDIEGLGVAVAELLEGAQNCVALRSRGSAELAAYFTKKRP